MKAKTVKTFNFVRSVIVFSCVLLFGIAFLAFFLLFNKAVPDNYVETTATITRIDEEKTPFYDETDGIDASDYEYHVFVEYSYNGETYSEKEYGAYSSSMKEGDTVLLYLNPDDPEEFMSDPSGDFVFVIVGIVVILIGAGGLGYVIYKRRKGE